MKRLCAVAAMVLAGSIVFPAGALACTVLPPTIQIDDLFESVVDDLLEASPTFNSQCERIADFPLMRVSVRMLPKGEESCCRARTTIRRYGSGAMIAWIEIPSPRTRLEYAELLGHEFEHVLEQIDLVDLDARADEGDGARRLADGIFETARAHRAGVLVATEAAIKRTSSAASPSLAPLDPGAPVACRRH